MMQRTLGRGGLFASPTLNTRGASRHGHPTRIEDGASKSRVQGARDPEQLEKLTGL